MNPRLVTETFTDEERAILAPHFTNLDEPVFALTNLPEVVKGALFARYSRSHKSLRRLFLDEFVGDLDLTGDLTVDATVGLKRAEQLYERVFLEYGDDSVAQLGGVPLACEQPIRAKACDAIRGVLPAATLSNVGIYGTGQAYEALLLRMRAHPLPEARDYAAMMLEELRKVIPSFLARVDRAERGGVWSEYL